MKNALIAAIVAAIVATSASGAAITVSLHDRAQDAKIAKLVRHDREQRARIRVLERRVFSYDDGSLRCVAGWQDATTQAGTISPEKCPVEGN